MLISNQTNIYPSSEGLRYYSSENIKRNSRQDEFSMEILLAQLPCIAVASAGTHLIVGL